MKYYLIKTTFLIVLSLSIHQVFSQSLQGKVVDKTTELPLAFAGIGIEGTSIGTISNENGFFSIEINEVAKNDSIAIQFLGYQPQKLSVHQLLNDSIVRMSQSIINLEEVLVLGNSPDPVKIIKSVVNNIDKNYPKRSLKTKVFIRTRTNSSFQKLKVKFVKSDFPTLDKNVVREMENIPRHFISFRDVLGECYFSEETRKSNDIKFNSIKGVALKETEGMKKVEKSFKKVFSQTKDNEYWKMKTGWLSVPIELDSTSNPNASNESEMSTQFLLSDIQNALNSASLDTKDEWDFLYNTQKYNYILSGATQLRDEIVYIINFNPREKGLYKGVLYISNDTYALLKADFAFVEGKKANDVDMFGIAYSEDSFRTNVTFEKSKDRYRLKYLFHSFRTSVGYDRNLTLVKKRKRFLFDKTLNEFEMGLDMAQQTQSSVELLVLDEKEISQQTYNDFQQAEKMPIIQVRQFNDKLWEGYSIIEPTKQMKTYQKSEE